MKTEYSGGPVAGGTFPAEIWHDFMTDWIRIRDERKPGPKEPAPEHGARPPPPRPRAPPTPTAPTAPPAQTAPQPAAPQQPPQQQAPAAATAGRAPASRPPPRPPAAAVTAAAPRPARRPRCGARRIAGGHGARHVPAVGVAEAPGQLGRLGDADPGALDQPRRGRARLDRDRPAGEQAPVQLQADAQRLGQLAGARAQVLGALEPAAAVHLVEARRVGSSARISTAAPTPSGSHTALSRAWMP